MDYKYKFYISSGFLIFLVLAISVFFIFSSISLRHGSVTVHSKMLDIVDSSSKVIPIGIEPIVEPLITVDAPILVEDNSRNIKIDKDTQLDIDGVLYSVDYVDKPQIICNGSWTLYECVKASATVK